jgi:hypothetical protein
LWSPRSASVRLAGLATCGQFCRTLRLHVISPCRHATAAYGDASEQFLVVLLSTEPRHQAGRRPALHVHSACALMRRVARRTRTAAIGPQDPPSPTEVERPSARRLLRSDHHPCTASARGCVGCLGGIEPHSPAHGGETRTRRIVQAKQPSRLYTVAPYSTADRDDLVAGAGLEPATFGLWDR